MAGNHLDWIQYYKPSKRAWIAVCVLGLCAVAIVYAVVSSNMSLSAKGAYDFKLNIGEKSQPITVIQNIQQKVGL